MDMQDLLLFIEGENILHDKLNNNNKSRHIGKLKILKNEHNRKIKINNNNNEDWFVNKTDKNIPTNVKWLLSLGPKHALPNTIKTFPLFKCIADGEDIIRTLENREQQEIARSKLTSLIDGHLNKTKLNVRDKLTLDTVVQTRDFLNENKDVFILSSDKGNKTVAVMKDDYLHKMREIVGDMCTYQRLKKDPTATLQNKNNLLIEQLFNLNLITVQEKYKLSTRTSIAPRIYGLPKIHKEGTPLRPICSSVNSPAYGLCKYMVGILKNLTKESKYNVKDAIEFKSRINKIRIEDDEIMVSFDVVALFPSIPVNLALQTIEENWNILENYTKIPKKLFMDILSFCIKDTRYFKYEDKIFEQRKGMPMGSPASPVIADIIMEKLLDFSVDLMGDKPKILTKYVDDLFCVIKRKDVNEVLRILNSFNRQICFTKEEENENRIPYLDCVVLRQNNLLRTDWYQKPTSSGRLINFYSKHPRRIIINTATNFIRRVFEISDDSFHKDNFKRKIDTLKKNEFPIKTIKDLIKHAKSKKLGNQEEEKLNKIYKSVTYIPGFSERLKNSNIYNKEKYEIALKTNNSVYQLFSKPKTKLEKEDKSNLIYKISCEGDGSNICPKVYVGTTKSTLKTRLSGHKSDHKAVTKPIEQKTALAAHCTITGHKPNFNNVSILQEECNYAKRYTLEMLHIVNTPTNLRLNYKTDTDKISHIYKYTINKHRHRKQK